MGTKMVVGGSSVTASQMKDFWRQVGDGSLNGDHFQALLEHRDPFTGLMDTESQLKRWCGLIKESFGVEIDPSSVKVPERQSGFDRLIVVPKGITLNQLVAVLRQKFSVSLYFEDFDSNVIKNDHVNTETYAIWVRDRVEADEENQNLSANDCNEKGINGQTLLERLLHELVYFSETGKHLDIQNWTLCSGSRGSDGIIPSVNWDADDRGLLISWSGPGGCYSGLRVRSVVS